MATPDGSPSGIGIDLMRAVARHAGLEVGDFVPSGLADGIKALREGKLDVLLGVTETAARRADLSFIGPYRTEPVALVSARGYPVWSLHQLEGRRLAMVKGYFGGDLVKRLHPGVELVDCAPFDQCLDRLDRGEVDAAAYALPGLAERLKIRDLRRLAVTGVIEGMFDQDNLTVSSANPALAARLAPALELAMAQELPRLQSEWASASLRPDTVWAEVRKWLIGAAVVLALALLGWWAHSRRLRRETMRADAALHESEGYLAFMAHEVRNALQSVSGAVALAQAQAQAQAPTRAAAPGGARWSDPRGPEPDQGELMNALSRSARSTLGLMDALLDRHRL